MPEALFPFEISATEIADLPADRLVALLNRLVEHEGRTIRVPPNCLKTSLRTTDPDQGIDAWTDAGTVAGYYVEAGVTAWQFKKTWPGRPMLERELSKPGVQEAFGQGGGYTLILGQDMAPPRHSERETILQNLARPAGCKGNIRLLYATHVAAWASTVPAALFELRPQILEYFRADQFLERDPRHQIPFEPDEVRVSILGEIERTLFGSGSKTSHARIQGPSGVGKTRLALELVRRLDLHAHTLYIPEVPASKEIFGWVAANEDARAILIVDECSEAEKEHLETLAAQCQGRLQLITVGPGATTGPNVYSLDVLDETTMERVIRTAAPELFPEQVLWVARVTRGYVKLAVVAATAIQSGHASIAGMSTDAAVHETVSRLLLPTEDSRRALAGIALLTRVGWEGSAAEEGTAIAEFLGMDWNHMQTALAPAVEQGIAVKRGRYRYVSPELLALWLAAGFWRSQAYRINDLLQNLPNLASKDAFLERLSQLGSLPEVRSVLEEILGPEGPFRDIEALDKDWLAPLFRAMAKGAPLASVQALRRILEPVPVERLASFGPGRRDILWALEALVESKEAFWDAARLIRKLAEAENERISNSATGVWSELFLTFLGPTEVPALERLSLVEEALTSPSHIARLLAVDAIASALESMETGLAYGSSGDVPARRWRPGTWGEVWQVKRRALFLLNKALGDPFVEVRRAARKAFVSHARGLVYQGLTEEVISWFSGLEGEDEKERRDIWESIQDVVKYAPEDSLTPEQRLRLELEAKRFYGDSLADRIKRYTGRFSHVDWPDEKDGEEGRPERIAERLAEEASTAMEEIRPLLPWLFSGEAEMVWPFARRLGHVDIHRSWLDPLFSAARDAVDKRPLSGYLAGRAEAGDEAWQQSLLDAWSEHPELTQIVYDATVRSSPNDKAVERILRLMERGWIQPEWLGFLRFGSWGSGISLRPLTRLIDRLLGHGSAVLWEAAAILLSNWLAHPNHGFTPALQKRAWLLLESYPKSATGTMYTYYWERVASRMIAENPQRLARLVILLANRGHMASNGRMMGFLQKAMRMSPEMVWEVLGQTLLDDKRLISLTWSLQESGLILNVPIEILDNWLSRKGVTGARAMAASVRPEGDEPPAIVRLLIQRYGKDVGRLLASAVTTGFWSGSEAEYLKSKVDMAEHWQKDPAMRDWATNLRASLEREMQRARIRDEEISLR